MPLAFIENQGQVDRRADFYVAGKDQAVFFTPQGLTISLGLGRASRAQGPARPAGPVWDGRAGRRWNARLDFVGANAGVHPQGEAETATAFSYFRGRPQDWRAGVPAYSRLVYRDLWPGVDLVYSGSSERLKYEFIVRPGADPSRVRLAYKGVSGLSVDGDGRLRVETAAGPFRDDVPVAYQVAGGKTIRVPVAYRLEGSVPDAYGYRFEVGEYDHSRPLVLDPATIVSCGFLGSAADDQGNAVAIDSSGCAYVTGSAGYYDFPVTVGPDLTFNSISGGSDAFVAKVNASGTALVYCGYLGGSADDVGKGIAVDASGNAYVTGWTFSQDFPAVVGPGLFAHGNITQYSDAFVAKVNASGTSLTYCGFVGGSANEQGNGIAVDSSGNAYLAGWTESSDFTASVGPDLSPNGSRDAFVAKVNAAGTGFVYAGFIGGLAEDGATAIAVDGSGNAYVTGYANSTPAEGFPVTNGPSLTYHGNQDAFVARVDHDGTKLDYCGYIGGTDIDIGAGIAVDASGAAYVVGTSDSHFQFPVKGGPDLVHHDGDDAFVAKVSPSGAELVYCGFVGGSGNDQGIAVAVDGAGIAYVAGATDSADDFPVAGGPGLVEAGAIDAFVATVSADGDRLIYCGFIGGSENDTGNGIATDGTGNVYVTGTTSSGDFPVTAGSFLNPGGGFAGMSDAFVARISEDLPPLAPAGLHVVSATTTGITIAWTDRSSDETGFKVERKKTVGGT
ncbi:MAG TPA: SBBP repeat-containing protein, partial [Burkholderiales bacterium]|nr:SBBP repeat-containing protein [Burkholderiales bacterium]